MYPNPAGPDVWLRSAVRLSAPAALTVLDAQGRTVGKTTLPTGQQEQQLPLAGAADGVYFLRIQWSSGLVVQRLVLP